MFLGSSSISGVTGRFVGGCLAHFNDEYLLLDSTPASPRLIRLKATLVMGDAVPSVSVVSSLELPLSGQYYGVGVSRGAVVLLRAKGVICEDGRIAVAELLTVDVESGSVLDIEEVYSYENITLLGGLCAVGTEWRFLGEFGGVRRFYGIYADGEVRTVARFTQAVTGRSALAYNETLDSVLVLNGSNKVLSFQSEWLMAEMSEDIDLESDNDEPVGVAWTGNAVAVLEASPLSLYWYGETGVIPSGTPEVTLTDRRQFSVLGFLAETFAIGATEFKGIRGQRVRRYPVDDAAPSYEEVTEVRITPEFPLRGVRVGMHITQGSRRWQVRGIFEVGDAYKQSFVVR